MKKILSIFLILSMGVQSFGSEFSVYAGSGLSTLMNDEKGSDNNFWLGGLLGFGYAYFFAPNLGLGSGLEMTFYNAEYNFKKYTQRPYPFTDFQGNDMEFRSTIYGYKEEQSAMLLQIPFMLQYQRSYKDKLVYAAAGTKIGIPLTGKSEAFADSIKNSGYSEYVDNEFTTQEFLGFGTYPKQKSEKKLALQTAVLLSAETGIKWKLNEDLRLYTGIYFDYGLNPITKRNSNRVVEYISQERAFVFNNIIEEVTPLAIGLKLKLSFDTGALAEAEALRKATEEETASLALEKETVRLAAEKEVARLAEEKEAARLAAEEEAAHLEAKKEVARLASIQEGYATTLQAKIDSIQNQVLNDFHITQTKPSEKQIPALNAIIALLKDHPELRFYINGHTCDQGNKETNRIVGYERAKAVRDYVVAKGIDEKRILGIGSKLNYEPLVPNTSEENRKKNRRVEFVIEKWLPPTE
ncbi:MAG: OmpA family protein [Fibromonadaceae bacterium]|jgi:outer membrane protein OmpA-like peptidoglycan-associated protein|nr:OmpA family protein [Fibromonadaceae bacterium]